MVVADPDVMKMAIKASQVFDQALRYEVQPITPEELRTMRRRWFTVKKRDPPPHLDMSDTQLSVLQRLNEVDHNLLAFDMGVWGPYGARRERRNQLAAQVKNADGFWITRGIPGAMNLEDWIDGWRFASTGFIMGAYLDEGVADGYRDFFVALAKSYPDCWWICCKAEWELRHEWAIRERRRQEQFHIERAADSQYDGTRPWNAVLSAAFEGLESMRYWKAEVEDKARQWKDDQLKQQASHWQQRQEALYDPMAGGQGSVPPPPQPYGGGKVNPQNPAGTGKRAQKRAAAVAAAAAGLPNPKHQRQEVGGRGQEGGAPGKGAGEWWNERRSDGRYMYAENKVQLCCDFNRNH